MRNPLYFGDILLAIAVGFMASRTGFAILLLGMILFDYRLILREESEPVVSQGEIPGLLRSGSSTAACNAPEITSGRKLTELEGRFVGRGLYVDDRHLGRHLCSQP